jgi:hypothetical protein
MVEEEEMSTDPGKVKVEPEIRRRRVQQRGFSKEEEEEAGEKRKSQPILKADQKRTGQEKKS